VKIFFAEKAQMLLEETLNFFFPNFSLKNSENSSPKKSTLFYITKVTSYKNTRN
jgi:hypothetical protein